MSKERNKRLEIERKTGRPASTGANWKEIVEVEEEKFEKHRQLVDSYKWLSEHPIGRVVLQDLLQLCMTFETTMTGNSYTYFNEGKRSIGLYIMKKIQSNLIKKILED